MSATREIGFPRETAATERRTILTPDLAGSLVEAGYRVLAEPNIGHGVGIADSEYTELGAELVNSADAWSAPLILRYKSGPPDDIRRLEKGQALAAIFHAEGDRQMLDALVASRARAYSYEFMREGTESPMMRAGGHIAGVQAALLGARHLQSHLGGRGVLLGGIPGADPARVVVIGSGNVGSAAAQTAAALGADVRVLTHTEDGRTRYLATAPPGVSARVNTPDVLRAELAQADLVIGCILISTHTTPAMIDRHDLALMPEGAVIVDATCGYGDGYLPTAGPAQQPDDPPRVVDGVLHVKVDLLPALVPITATQAYTAAAAPYLRRLADSVLNGTDDPVAESALIADDGRLVHPVLREHAEYYETVA